MADRDPETQKWKLKLADLEYGKKFKFGLNTGTSDPKTVCVIVLTISLCIDFLLGHTVLHALRNSRPCIPRFGTKKAPTGTGKLASEPHSR